MANKIQLQILAHGKFNVTVNEKTWHGKFNMSALERFLDRNSIPGIYILTEMFALGMKPSQYADYILSAVQELMGEQIDLDKKDIMQWMDLWGGYAGNDVKKIIAYGMRSFARTRYEVEDKESGEKKTVIELTDEEKKIFDNETA